MANTGSKHHHGVVTEGVLPDLEPPATTIGVIGWLRDNLFSSIGNSILTVVGLLLLAYTVPPILDWTLFDAVWSGGSDACRANPDAACWTFAGSWWEFFIYGFYDKSRSGASTRHCGPCMSASRS
ncbi:MAG: hypothetical protein M5U09_02885 [Gammaproteobacteria bacterium]|nr:hypothetical protein [Gammaproteobacteria bacterium]